MLVQSFLDMIAPNIVKFEPDYSIFGNTFRCCWALREYPTSTTEQAILQHLGEMAGVTLHIYARQVPLFPIVYGSMTDHSLSLIS